MVASVLTKYKFGNMVSNISFEANPFNWSFMFLDGCLPVNQRNCFHSILISDAYNRPL